MPTADHPATAIDRRRPHMPQFERFETRSPVNISEHVAFSTKARTTPIRYLRISRRKSPTATVSSISRARDALDDLAGPLSIAAIGAALRTGQMTQRSLQVHVHVLPCGIRKVRLFRRPCPGERKDAQHRLTAACDLAMLRRKRRAQLRGEPRHVAFASVRISLQRGQGVAIARQVEFDAPFGTLRRPCRFRESGRRRSGSEWHID
jgi:hypothetical protein